MAYRANKQDSTGFSPYQLIYGPSMTLPCDSQQPQELNALRPGALYLELKDRLRKLHGRTRIVNEAARKRQKRGFDRRYHPISKFRVNDAVWLHCPIPQEHGKFRRPWSGPYRIIEVLEPTSYRIRPWGHHSGRTSVVHANRLKPCYRMPPEFSEQSVRTLEWLSSCSESVELASSPQSDSDSDSSSSDCVTCPRDPSRSASSGTTEV